MKQGTPDHPKMVMLAGELDAIRRRRDPRGKIGAIASKVIAIGLLESLWHWCRKYAPMANLGKWPSAAICQGIGYEWDPDELIAALVRCGWLDQDPQYGLVIHDIKDHADNGWRQNLTYAGLTWYDGTPPRRNSTGRPRKLHRNSKVTPQKLQGNSTPFLNEFVNESLNETNTEIETLRLNEIEFEKGAKLQENSTETPKAAPSNSFEISRENSGLVSPEGQGGHSTPRQPQDNAGDVIGDAPGPGEGCVNPKGFSASIFRLLGVPMGDRAQFAADDTTWRRMAEQINGGCLGPPLEAAKRICTVAANFRTDPTKRNKAGALVDWFKRELAAAGQQWPVPTEAR